MLTKRRRGTAEPRWGWSGVAPITAPPLSVSDIDLAGLLPGHQSPVEQIVLTLRDLGGKYHRYLHQDEFGPSRAERMAGLRSLLDQLELLSSRLSGLPGQLHLRLSKQLASNGSIVERSIDGFHAHRNDKAAVEWLGQAAGGVRLTLQAASATGDAELMDDLGRVAEKTLQLLWNLDTTTAGAVVIDTELLGLEVEGGAESVITGFALVCAGIERLRRRAELTLVRLEGQKGPERCESLRWLVCQLCDLYRRETGQPVTSSARAKNHFTGTPQSRAGRFVMAAVEALQPAKAWAQEPDHGVAQRRARILHTGRRGRTVYFAMREYVACHSSGTGRRGRWKRAK